MAKKNLLYSLVGGAAVMVIGAAFGLGVIYGLNLKNGLPESSAAADKSSPSQNQTASAESQTANLAEAVIPPAGVSLPVKWGSLGKQLVEKGVIDRDQFIALYNNRPGLGPNEQKMLDGDDNGNITINPDNAGVILNLFWALGLGNKNSILDTGPMVDSRYGGAGNFASTGGWNISKGNAMDHYSKYSFIKLAKDEQASVERVSQNIYRPCCNNSTYFPDCNHGMAMLGLLELMAAQGISEQDMYKIALQVNSYWFPDTYLTLAAYEAKKNIPWQSVDPRKILGPEYSSASGYSAVRSQVQPVQQSGGGGCGV